MTQTGEQNVSRALTATLIARIKAPVTATNLSIEGERYPDLSPLERGATEELSSSQVHTEGANVLPIPAPTFYTTDQLSKRPQPTAEAELDAPEIRPIIASGKMILKLWINELGEVIDVEVERTELPEAFSRTAVAAFRRLHFSAGERHGQRVGSVMRIEVSYDDGRVPSVPPP